jgi:hypothetical protein
MHGVVAERVALVGNHADSFRVLLYMVAPKAKGGFDVVLLQNSQELGRVDRVGAVIKGQAQVLALMPGGINDRGCCCLPLPMLEWRIRPPSQRKGLAVP